MPHVRRTNDLLQEPFHVLYPHGQANADANFTVFEFARRCRITRVTLVNPTGLAQDVANYVDTRIMNGAVVVANWSTQTGQEGSITADTSVELTLSTDSAELVFEAGDSLVLDFNVTGTGVLPAGHVNVEGTYF